MKGLLRYSLAVWACFVFFNGALWAQDQDLFGIERKLGGRKSESDMGNVFRNAVSNFSFEVSTGAGYHHNRLNFSSVDLSAYPIAPELSNAVGDETRVFEGADYVVPVNVGLRLDMFGFFTIGGGYGKEFGRIENPAFENHLFNLEGDSYTFDKFYGTF